MAGSGMFLITPLPWLRGISSLSVFPEPVTLGVSSPLHRCHLATPTSLPAGHIPVRAHHGESPEGGGQAQLRGRGASPLPLSSPGHFSPSSSRLPLGLWLPGPSWKGQGSLKAPAAPMALQPHNTDKSFPRPDVRRAGHPGQMCGDHGGPQWPQPRWVQARGAAQSPCGTRRGRRRLMKVKGRLLLRMAEFCPTLLSTCAAASSAGGGKRGAVSTPRRRAVSQTSSTSPPQRVATSLGTSAGSRAPWEGQMGLAQCPWQTPVPHEGGCAQASAPPPARSPQEGRWAQPGAPQNPLCPRQRSWLSPNPQPPTHLPGSSPSVSRPGQAVPELQSKQGVTPGKGSTPTFPKSCFTVGCPPPPTTNTFPAKLRVPTPRAGQGPRPGRDSARPRPHWAPAPRAGRGGRGGGP